MDNDQDIIEEYNAAICASNEAGYAGITAAQTIRYLMERAEAAEEKLAELEKQDPVEYQYYCHNHGTGTGQWLKVANKQIFERMKGTYAGDNDFSFRELFSRPVPAVNVN